MAREGSQLYRSAPSSVLARGHEHYGKVHVNSTRLILPQAVLVRERPKSSGIEIDTSRDSTDDSTLRSRDECSASQTAELEQGGLRFQFAIEV